MIDTPQDFLAFGRANLAAVTQSGQIWAAGLKQLAEQFVTGAKASYEDAVAQCKALGAVKTPAELVELQQALGKTLVATSLAETQKLAEAAMQLGERALAPLAARMTASAESFRKAA